MMLKLHVSLEIFLLKWQHDYEAKPDSRMCRILQIIRETNIALCYYEGYRSEELGERVCKQFIQNDLLSSSEERHATALSCLDKVTLIWKKRTFNQALNEHLCTTLTSTKHSPVQLTPEIHTVLQIIQEKQYYFVPAFAWFALYCDTLSDQYIPSWCSSLSILKSLTAFCEENGQKIELSQIDKSSHDAITNAQLLCRKTTGFEHARSLLLKRKSPQPPIVLIWTGEWDGPEQCKVRSSSLIHEQLSIETLLMYIQDTESCISALSSAEIIYVLGNHVPVLSALPDAPISI